MNSPKASILIESKEAFFLFIYFAVIISVSIYLVFDHWHPVPIRGSEYNNFQKTVTRYLDNSTGNTNVTEKETIKTNGSIQITIRENDTFDPKTQSKTVVRNETGMMRDSIKNNFALLNDPKIEREFQLIILTLLFGLIGSSVHGLSSLVNYVATSRYSHNWYLWYLGRPFIGGIVALTFYVLIRGGILSINAQPSDLNYFGIAAISLVAGLVAAEGTKKIRDIFMILFGSAEKREKGEEEIEVAKKEIEVAKNKIENAENKIDKELEKS